MLPPYYVVGRGIKKRNVKIIDSTKTIISSSALTCWGRDVVFRVV
jgi:hypothetical protein